MRLIDDDYNYYDALVLNYNKAGKGNLIEGYSAYIYIKSDNMDNQGKYKALYFGGQPYKPALFSSRNRFTYSVYQVFFPPCSIVEVYATNFNVNNARDEDFIEELDNFRKYLQMGKIKSFDLKLTDKHMANEYVHWMSLKDSILSSKCIDCEYRNKHVSALSNETNLKKSVAKFESQIKESEIVFGFKDTEKMLQVMRDLNFINENNIPQLKTRVARELGGGTENLYITELLMKNVLDKLEPEEIVAVISVFVAQGRSRDEFDLEELDVPETLMVALRQCTDIFTMIGEAEKKHEIEGSLEPNFLLVKPLYEWAKGRDFVEITLHTEVLEGAIVRSIQRVEQTLRSIKKALTVIGNDTQLENVEKATVIIKRDIAFALSLYIDENKEILG